MKLSEIKNILPQLTEINFVLPNGGFIPKHFHITEIGEINKHFIDCGGVERIEKKVNFQLWEAEDFDHRLSAKKLMNIIELSEKLIGIGDYEIEVEYQKETICKYSLGIEGETFILVPTQTDCLAPDKCGIPVDKVKVSMSELNRSNSNCSPEGGCC